MRLSISLIGLFLVLSVRAETTLELSAPTDIRVYAKTHDRYQALLIFQNTQYLGINPINASTRCQFWSYSKEVIDTAMTALAEDLPVKLVFKGRDASATRHCQVVSLELKE